MSLFTSIRDEAVSAFAHITALVGGIFTKDVQPALITFLHVLETNGGALLISLALDVVKGAEAGTPFGQLTTALIDNAKAQGIEVIEIAAHSALQVAQTSIEQA